MVQRARLSGFDGFALGVLLTLLGIGVLTLYGIQPVNPLTQESLPYFFRQAIWILVGAVAFVLMASIDYHTLARFAYPIWMIAVVLLVGVLAAGRSIQGARRWISLGFFSIQPSELAKIGLLFVLAKVLSDTPRRGGLSLPEMATPALLIGLPMLLILKQPDLGTGLALLSISAAIIFVVGLRSKLLIYSLLFGMIAFPFFWLFFWNHLRDYQKARLLTFINPAHDTSGAGYHIAQSKIAIGSGQLFGKGLFGGTQSQLKFLPEGHTDFVFAVFAEAWGFAGVAVMLILFLLLIVWGIEIALRAKDRLGSLLAVGVVGLFSFHVIINIGMALGSMPTVGIPLPLISYGGTAMVTTLGLFGLLLNIKLRRFTLFY